VLSEKFTSKGFNFTGRFEDEIQKTIALLKNKQR